MKTERISLTEEMVKSRQPVSGLDLHARAEKILADEGKTEYTEDEYVAAIAKAERELKRAYRAV